MTYQLLDSNYKELTSGSLKEIQWKLDELKELEIAERQRESEMSAMHEHQSDIFDHI